MYEENAKSPPSVAPERRLLLITRGLRAFVDGYVAVLLPAYLLALGHGTWQVGLLSTATLLGSAIATMAVGTWGHYFHQRRLLLAAALLMIATGLGFAGLSDFWPLLAVAFVGTLNPGSGDVSVFLPLEHARLAAGARGAARTTVFARYSLVGALFAALGALASGVPDGLAHFGVDRVAGLRIMFLAYSAVGGIIWLLYRGFPEPEGEVTTGPPAPLGPSRPLVVRLAALFSLDAFAGGLAVQSLMALWLFQKFDLSISAAGTFFFAAGLFSALSQLAAPWVAGRIGLLNTMVFTHIPSSLALIAAAFSTRLEIALGFLLLRAALSQMDVPTRSAYVMAIVTPPERAAAASYTAVPRSLAASLSPTLGGALFAAGWLAAPLVACGCLKIAYDLMLLRTFRKVMPGELD
jgi:MFS family permease